MCAFNIAVTAVTRPQRVRARARQDARQWRGVPRDPSVRSPSSPPAPQPQPHGPARVGGDLTTRRGIRGMGPSLDAREISLFVSFILILYKSIHDSVSCVASRAALRTHGRLRVAQSERRQSRRCATVPVCSLISLHASCGPAPLPHARASLQSMCPQTRAERCLAVFDSTHINTRANRCASSS